MQCKDSKAALLLEGQKRRWCGVGSSAMRNPRDDRAPSSGCFKTALGGTCSVSLDTATALYSANTAVDAGSQPNAPPRDEPVWKVILRNGTDVVGSHLVCCGVRRSSKTRSTGRLSMAARHCLCRDERQVHKGDGGSAIPLLCSVRRPAVTPNFSTTTAARALHG